MALQRKTNVIDKTEMFGIMSPNVNFPCLLFRTISRVVKTELTNLHCIVNKSLNFVPRVTFEFFMIFRTILTCLF